MQITNKKIEKYCIENSTPIHQVLYELERETHLKTLAPQMLSGQLQGQFLQMICQMIQPKRILEIGTFTGYSAISLALGCSANSRIDTIEINVELEPMIRNYIERAGLSAKIKLHFGDAMEIIPSLEGPYDLIFIDAGKQDYQTYFELVMKLVERGSFILTDNVLWDGKVILDGENDDDAEAIKAYNKMILNEERLDVIMLPVRDGISIARVK